MPSRVQSALDPAGIQAARIEGLWWLMFWVCTAVYVAMMIALVVAVVRSRRGRDTATDSRTLVRRVALAVGLSTAALVGLLFASVLTGRAMGSLSAAPVALTIEITGYQWWWKVEYKDDDPSRSVTTANELHLPVGRPVSIRLRSGDVIHSLWMPTLHGKTDLIPGRDTWTFLQADRAGTYRGQCAEFCGLQHARMALTVVVLPGDEFDKWLEEQRQTPPPPSAAEQKRGHDVVESTSCALCHTVQGTIAGARTAPDLTHFGARVTIGAGTMPNTRESLDRWLVNPQDLKPGNHMPPPGLSDDDRHAVVAYLESLR
jgi:cytochrome c oxidase subunit 2